MTRSDLHTAFKIEMDKNAQGIAFGGCPAFLPEEIDYIFNRAFYDVIVSKFSGNNATEMQFESSVKRIADLETLVKTDEGIPVSVTENTNKIVLENFLDKNENSNGRMFFVQATLHWTNDESSNSAILNLISHKDSKRFVETYNNKPWIDNPVAVMENNILSIFIDKYSMTGDFTLDITYVKHPKKMEQYNADEQITEFPEQVLGEIINKAVVIALENIESQRVQTKASLNLTSD